MMCLPTCKENFYTQFLFKISPICHMVCAQVIQNLLLQETNTIIFLQLPEAKTICFLSSLENMKFL